MVFSSSAWCAGSRITEQGAVRAFSGDILLDVFGSIFMVFHVTKNGHFNKNRGIKNL